MCKFTNSIVFVFSYIEIISYIFYIRNIVVNSISKNVFLKRKFFHPKAKMNFQILDKFKKNFKNLYNLKNKQFWSFQLKFQQIYYIFRCFLYFSLIIPTKLIFTYP